MTFNEFILRILFAVLQPILGPGSLEPGPDPILHFESGVTLRVVLCLDGDGIAVTFSPNFITQRYAIMKRIEGLVEGLPFDVLDSTPEVTEYA